MEDVHDIIIIGAGICGIAAARKLREEGRSVLLLDKSRGVGGRMSTRRVSVKDAAGGDVEARLDHGAQFFTVRDEGFRRVVDELTRAGVAREWCRGFPRVPEDASGGDFAPDGHPRYRGVAGINHAAQYLARDLDVRLNHRVTRMAFADGAWRLECENASVFQGRSLLMTTPVPQILELLAGSPGPDIPRDARAALERIEYDPCIAALLILKEPANLPVPGALQAQSEPIDFISDNGAKGISPVPAVTIHGGPRFSREHLENDPSEAARLLTEAAGDLIPTGSIESITGHRWRYAKPSVLHPERCLKVTKPGPLVFAGDAFGEARVEGAFLSGLAAAEALLA